MNHRSLGSGHGALRTSISNTLAATDRDVASVSFAFACTGPATVNLRFLVNGKEVAAARATHACGQEIFQRSLEVPRLSAIGFDADVTASTAGGFAYAYLPEKTNS